MRGPYTNALTLKIVILINHKHSKNSVIFKAEKDCRATEVTGGSPGAFSEEGTYVWEIISSVGWTTVATGKLIQVLKCLWQTKALVVFPCTIAIDVPTKKNQVTAVYSTNAAYYDEKVSLHVTKTRRLLN